MKKIIRVFPRKTRATPDDDNVRINTFPSFFDEADEIHISVTFTWDMNRAERLAEQWKFVAPVEMGGPAFNQPGEKFTPGMYVKNGYVITSRGCPNRCWFCQVWKREQGQIREFDDIPDGHNILDDNLLATSESHIRKVFEMLQKQKQPIEFTGGLEAKILQDWHVDEIMKLKLGQAFFAYDTPDDLEPLIEAGKKFKARGHDLLHNHSLRCYVLCGYKKDTFEKAEQRMRETILAGFMPMAMVFRDKDGNKPEEWKKWQRLWARPAIIHSKIKEILSK